MKHSGSLLPRCGGFSTAELLVASGVIAVLLAVLMPVASSVRADSADARCMSNLRQIGMAGLAHSQERGGLLPDMGLYNSVKFSEVKYSLLPYLGYPVTGDKYEQPTVFTCPLAWKNAPTETPTYRTYAINRYATSSRVNQPDDFEKIEAGLPKRLQNVSDPAKMAFFMEGYHRGGGPAATYYVDQNYARMKPETTSYLHRNAMFVVFMDGHVERLHASKALAELTERSSTTHPFWGSSH